MQGIAVVTGADLLAQYRHLGFTGALVVITTSNPNAIPTFANLGSDANVYWIRITHKWVLNIYASYH